MTTTPPPRRDQQEPILGDRYRLGALLGAGGMGVVYAAEDLRLQRRVAVKVLPPHIDANELARERLRAEALAAAALDHPFICKIHEIGEASEQPFIVMEYVEGETLHERAAREPLTPRQIVDIAAEVADALDEAHRRNVIHRDLKPANIMVTAQGHVKVMDFGLAKRLAPQGGSAVGPTAITEPGTRVGTTAYMSPEQLLGAELDARSDIFSLGVILHELATGRHPFAHDEPSGVVAAILTEPPARHTGDFDALPALGALITRMLAKACAERPQSMRELRLRLEALREHARTGGALAGGPPTQEAPAERTPFIGRDSERAELVTLLDAMLGGHGGCVLIGGEPGVGKTRLGRELLKIARERGCLCLTGHCYEMEGAPPFVPFVEIVEESVRLVPAAVRAALSDAAPVIASIVPSLRRSYADIAALPDLGPEERRRLAFGAFVEYVRRGTQKSPTVLLLDDLQWADESTLQLLTILAAQLPSMRLLVVGTYRDIELDVRRPFAKTLEALLRQRSTTRLTLRRLGESAVTGMLAALGGSAPPSGLARAVFRETDGNPFFVEEVYRHLDEEAKLFDEQGRWKPELRTDSIAVPEGVRLVVGRRLERLGEQARKLLTAAAVIGRSFPLEVLNAAVDLPPDAVLDALEEAERMQLIAVESAGRSIRYGFVHELIRATLINALSLPRRQRLHLRIADALEASGAAALERGTSMLAHHLYQAGAAAGVERTAAALTAALHGANAGSAFAEALELSDDLLTLELPANDAHLCAALEQRGVAFAGLDRHEEASAAWDRALGAYAARGDDAGVSRCARVAARTAGWLGRVTEAAALCRRGLAALTGASPAERIALELGLARAMIVQGLIDEAQVPLAKVLAAAERTGNSQLLTLALSAKALGHTFSAEYDAAYETGRRALATYREDDVWGQADEQVKLAQTCWQLGRLDEVEELRRTGEPLARRALHFGALWNHEGLGCTTALARTGDFAAYLAIAERAALGPRFAFIVKCHVALAQLYSGDAERALAEIAAVVAAQPAEHWMMGLVDGCAFLANALAGRDEEARALAPAVERRLPQQGRRNTQGMFAALATYVLGNALLRDRARCAAVYPLTLLEIATGAQSTLTTLPISNPRLSAALAAEGAGLFDEACEHFEAAIEQAHRVPLRPVQPVARFFYGRCLAERESLDDRTRGRELLAAALDDFRTLNMSVYARHAEQALAGTRRSREAVHRPGLSAISSPTSSDPTIRDAPPPTAATSLNWRSASPRQRPLQPHGAGRRSRGYR